MQCLSVSSKSGVIRFRCFCSIVCTTTLALQCKPPHNLTRPIGCQVRAAYCIEGGFAVQDLIGGLKLLFILTLEASYETRSFIEWLKYAHLYT
jgi:hypothetical protein